MKWFKYDIKDLSTSEYEKWYSCMSCDKRQKVDRLLFDDDKKRTVAGEMLARQAIADLFNICADSIDFGVNEYGKPFVKNLPVHFNISHSGNMVVCAVDDKPVGIDIEQMRPVDLKIAKHFFNEEELICIFGHVPSETEFCKTADDGMIRRFFELWTAKEACVKYTGKGLSGIDENCEASRQTVCFDDYVVTIVTE